jgi:large subunit ribosomal protein L15
MADTAGSASKTKKAAGSDSAETAASPASTPRAAGVLKVHHLRPAPGSHKPKTRVGRGEASKGKTAGRGTKGTKARYQVPERFEGGQMPLHMRLPKLKGFTNRFRTEYQVVNLEWIAAHYPKGGAVTPDDLVAKGAVRKGELIKVLGDGEIGVKLQVRAHGFSASAKDKIEAAGGTATKL